MVAVDAVIIEVLSCNNASMRYIFKGEKPTNLLVTTKTSPFARTTIRRVRCPRRQRLLGQDRGPQITLPWRMSLTSSGEQPSHSP